MAEKDLISTLAHHVARVVVLFVGFLSVLLFFPWIRQFNPPLSSASNFVGFCIIVAWVGGPFLLLIIGSFLVGTSAPGNFVILLTSVLIAPPGMLFYYLESRSPQPTGGMIVPIVVGFQFAACVVGIVAALLVKWWSRRRQARRITNG